MNSPLVKKLSKKEESAICLACGECCKKYWITVLPEEATKIAAQTKQKKGDFLEGSTQLHVKLFPKTTPGVLTYPSAFLPKRIYSLIQKEFMVIPESFFVVPQIVLKREEKNVFSFKGNKTKSEIRNACIFIDATNSCSIYEARPGPCKLFPFIAVAGFKEQYPFCELYQKTFRDYSIESRIYYKKIQNYFKNVDEKGFKELWRNPPREGLLFVQDKLVGGITLNELSEMMPKKEAK